jgi:uncharacterized protein
MFEFGILAAILTVAILYSSVGHGGASGYLAIMALFTIDPAITKPTAFILNVFVASIGTWQFYRAGLFSWRIFLPFAATSIPFSFLGNMIAIPIPVYKLLLGIVLILAAVRLAWKLTVPDGETVFPPIWIAMIIGAAIGLLSGLVGVGGGIFLTPVLLLMKWSETKVAAGVSAMFILVNSVAGIAGNPRQALELPSHVWLWVLAAIVGGLIGSTLGAKRFDSLTLRRVLSAVLLFAGVKLLLI